MSSQGLQSLGSEDSSPPLGMMSFLMNLAISRPALIVLSILCCRGSECARQQGSMTQLWVCSHQHADLVLPITGASSPLIPTEAQRLRGSAAHSHCNPSFHSPVQYSPVCSVELAAA